VPKPTFLNLSEEKRRRFVDVALKEFAEYEYRAASLNRIVAGADIAKGSIYQYFENKKDLYQYLVTYAAREKFRFMALNLRENPPTLKAFLFDLFTLSRLFDFHNPALGKLLLNTALEVENEELNGFLQEFRKLTASFYAEFAQGAAKRRFIRQDIDISFASFLLESFDKMICQYFEVKADRLYLDFVLDRRLSAEEKLEKIKSAIDSLVMALLGALV